MKPDWILIANASQARLLKKERGEPMVVIKSYSHSPSRSKASDLGNSRAGSERADRGFGGPAYQPRMDAQQKEHERFAHELGDDLERHALQGDFRSLRVFSCSPFLGELKAALGTATGGLIAGTHDLDLTHVGLAELEGRIREEVEEPHQA